MVLNKLKFAGARVRCVGLKCKHTQSARVDYYKWVPFMLAFQCLLCYLPHLFWKAVHPLCGINLKKLVQSAVSASIGESPQTQLAIVARSLSDTLFVGSRTHTPCIRLLCKRVGSYLTVLYLFVKVLYFANAVGQLVMMAIFLELPFTFGAKLLGDIHRGASWNITGVFPRVTFCKFDTHVGDLTVMSVCARCVIPLSFLLEAMYVALWCWFVAVAIISAYSFAGTFAWTCVRRRQFVKEYLDLADLENVTKKNRAHFIDTYLRLDGALALRMIAENTNELCVAQLVAEMWKRCYGDTPTTKLSGDVCGNGDAANKPEKRIDEPDCTKHSPSGDVKYPALTRAPDYVGASAPKFVDDDDDEMNGARRGSSAVSKV